MKYDLEKRTITFSKNVIDICKLHFKNELISPLIKQLIRSATSIGANYQEANGASSRKEFRQKILICKKEAMETKYWLELLAHSEVKIIDKMRILWKECHELTLLFSKIAKSSQ